jgi:beta-N-acetylhexosaminidase
LTLQGIQRDILVAMGNTHPTLQGFLAAGAWVTAAACARGSTPRQPEPETARVPTVEAVVPDSVTPPDTVTQPRVLRRSEPVPEVGELTLREKVAQLVMVRLPGEYWATDHEELSRALRLVADEQIGGFVIFAAASPYDAAAKLNLLQRASRLPLLVAADFESGAAWRIRGGTPFPGNMALGATGSEEDAYTVGRVAALEARAIGVHLVLAPVVDVNNNPLNPIINTRSFGQDPRQVGRLARAFIRGLQDHGVMATAKHFPGHGDTEVNSHLGLPVVTGDRARLDSVELVPFREVVAEGVHAVMSAHVTLPAVTGDALLPATVSARVLDTLLRRELAFGGLVLPDALDMAPITSRYGPGGSAVAALRAGADIILMPTDPRLAIDAVVGAVQSGELSEARIDSSVARVLAAKQRAGLFEGREVGLEAVARSVGRAENFRLADDIARRGLVLLRDDSASIPLSAARRRLLVIAYGDEANTTIGNGLVRSLRAAGRVVTLRRLWPASGTLSYDSVRVALRSADAVILVAAPRPQDFVLGIVVSDSLSALSRELAARGPPLVVISFGSPYLTRQTPTAPAFLVAWQDSEITERAAADALLGRIPITGRLPVAIPPDIFLGSGLARAAVAAPAASRP